MGEREEIITGLEYAWRYIKARPNPKQPPKVKALAYIKRAIELLEDEQREEDDGK